MKNFNDKYTIRDFIDKNKWSNVYMAINKETNKTVILNILLNTQGNEESLEKFKEEINLLKDINSPNVISINDMSTYVNKGKTYYYIESENFEGLTLDELIGINKLHEEQCLQIIRDVINGVKEFNNQKINFGNLTTENIIINGGGLVKIDTRSFINNHNGHINYNLYSSKKFDQHEDVHNIGSILCNIITGEKLFDRDKFKYLDKGICDILEKATNKKHISKHKYKNLDEFLNSIDLYLYGEEESENSVINFEKIHKLKSSPKIKKYITIACGAVIILCTTALAAQNIINRKSENVATTNISEHIDKTEEKTTDKTQKITPIEENLITPKKTAKVKKEKVTTKNNDDNMNNKNDSNKNMNVQNNNENKNNNNENKNNGNHNKVEKPDKEDTNNDNLDKNDNNTEKNPNKDDNNNTEENKGEEKPDNNSSNEEKPDQNPDNNQPNQDKNEDKDNNNNNEANDTENK